MTIEEKIKIKYGDNCSLVKEIKNTCYVIVSDGTYEYKIKNTISVSMLWWRTMTYDSRLKFLNSKCTNGVKIESFFIKHSTIKATFFHTETNYRQTKYIQKKGVSSECDIIFRNINKTNNWINKCKIKFGEKFSYSKSVYTHSMDPITVSCPTHGDFCTYPNKFLTSIYGCPQCGIEAIPNISRTSFNMSCKNENGNLYVIRCFNKEENFIKIGISKYNNLNKRFIGVDAMPYNYEEISIFIGNPIIIFDMEHIVHRNFKPYKYEPKIFFHGHTECFDIKIKDEAICFIQELLLNCTQQKQTGFLS